MLKYKKKYNFFNIFVLVCLVFCFSGRSVFAGSQGSQAGQSSAESSQVFPHGPSRVVVETVRPDTVTVVMADVPLDAVECARAIPSFTTLIQDQGVVNLNQPANCFFVRLGSVSVQPGLAVQPASPAAQIAVAASSAASQLLLHPSTAENLPPTFPMLITGTALLVVFRRYHSSVRVEPAVRTEGTHDGAFSLAELSVFRC